MNQDNPSLAYESLPLESLQRIESVCDRFERMDSGDRDIAELLAGFTGLERDHLIRELVALDVELRTRDGQVVGENDYSEFDDSINVRTIVSSVLMEIETPSSNQGSPQNNLPVGTKIGSYTVECQIGQGGMGVVYRGKREKDFEKNVAIKVIRKEYLSNQLVERFRHETKIQGGIGEHPNIASLIDAGNTDSGEPYLVMEYVDGAPLDDYMDSNELSVEGKLQVFQKILSGVSFAHQNAIIHRDIKPSNILVSKNGIPKIIDFGLAKLIDPVLDKKTATVAMTPMYASPEQIRGGHVSTSADIYSLGVVLYQTLTDHSPYENLSGSIQDLISKVTQDVPKPPSQRIRESGFQSDTLVQKKDSTIRPKSRITKQHGRRISGDLDQIVLKALRKEPQRRYKTVNEFSDDIERFLENKTVSARPDSLVYRLTKFVSRNKLAVSASCILLLTLLAGIVGTASGWQNAIAEQRKLKRERENLKTEQRKLKIANEKIKKNVLLLQKSVNLNRETIFEFMTDVSSSPALTSTAGTRQLRLDLFTKAGKKFETMVDTFSDDSTDQFELAKVQYWLGYINHDFGRDSVAKRNYESAISILEKLHQEQPANLEIRRQLGSTFNELGALMQKLDGELEYGLVSIQRAIQIWRELIAIEPKNPDYQQRLIRSLGNASLLLRDAERDQDANHAAIESRDLADQLSAENPDDAYVTFLRASRYASVASGLYLQRKFGESLKSYEEAFDILKPIRNKYPENPFYKWESANALYHIGWMQRMKGDFRGSLRTYNKALPLTQELIASDPELIKNQWSYGNIQNGIGATQLSIGEYEKALAPLLESSNTFDRLSQTSPQRKDFRQSLMGALVNLSYVYRNQKQFEKSIEATEKAVDVGTRLWKENPSMLLGAQITSAMGTMAGTLHQVGKLQQAQTTFEAAIKFGSEICDTYPTNPMPKMAHNANLTNYGEDLLENREYDRALDLQSLAIANLTKLTQDAPELLQGKRFLRSAYKNRADTYFWMKQYDLAIEDYDAALDIKGFRFQLDLKIERSCARLMAGDAEKAIVDVEQLLEKSNPNDPSVPFYASTFFSIAAEAALDQDEQKELIRRAIDLLAQSQKDDYAASFASIAMLKENRKLEFLRQQSEFRSWAKNYLPNEKFPNEKFPNGEFPQAP